MNTFYSIEEGTKIWRTRDNPLQKVENAWWEGFTTEKVVVYDSKDIVENLGGRAQRVFRLPATASPYTFILVRKDDIRWWNEKEWGTAL